MATYDSHTYSSVLFLITKISFNILLCFCMKKTPLWESKRKNLATLKYDLRYVKNITGDLTNRSTSIFKLSFNISQEQGNFLNGNKNPFGVISTEERHNQKEDKMSKGLLY